MINHPKDVPDKWLCDFCTQWKIHEFALYGSIVHGTVRPDSDVDVLITFKPEARWGLVAFNEMREQLELAFGRKVHLVSRRGIERSRNSIRRDEILSSAKVLYAAA